MDDLLLRSRLTRPVVTGTPAAAPQKSTETGGERESGSFRTVLAQQMEGHSEVAMSKHAAQRIEERSIELTESSIRRLNEGVEIAREKGLDDTLILVDQTAFIVSAKNRTVITAMSGSELKGNAITNINGTVII